MEGEEKLRKALELLDSKVTEAIEIFVCGGIVMMFKFNFRLSHDVDVLGPHIEELQEYSKIVAHELNLREDWMNWNAENNFNITRGLGRNWQQQAKDAGLLFQGKYISMYGLSRNHCLATKAVAFFDDKREKDAEDLKALKATEQEIRNLYPNPIFTLLEERHPGNRAKLVGQKPFLINSIIEELKQKRIL